MGRVGEDVDDTLQIYIETKNGTYDTQFPRWQYLLRARSGADYLARPHHRPCRHRHAGHLEISIATSGQHLLTAGL